MITDPAKEDVARRRILAIRLVLPYKVTLSKNPSTDNVALSCESNATGPCASTDHNGSARLLQGIVIRFPSQVNQALRASATASGFSAATFSNARAGPSGWRRPCSQFWRVEMLTPIINANSDCETSRRSRILLMSRFEIKNSRSFRLSSFDFASLLDARVQLVKVFLSHFSSSLTNFLKTRSWFGVRSSCSFF